MSDPAPAVRATLLTPGRPDQPDLLVVGPSLGTAVRPLWEDCTGFLPDRFTVVGWDLPGHGESPPVSDDELTVGELADAVRGVVAALGSPSSPAPSDRRWWYAGVSLGGAVGLELALDPPPGLSGVVVLCSGPRIGDETSWSERADLVSGAGTPVMVEGSAARWFAPGFLERDPATATALLSSLQDADRMSYVAACGALSRFDVRDRLEEVRVPVLAVAGSEDGVTPPSLLAALAAEVPDGRFAVVEGAAHLAPAEAPCEVAGLIDDFCTTSERRGRNAEVSDPTDGLTDETTRSELHARGMGVRREVLSDAHVDLANRVTDELTQDFQDLITRYAWGEIWTRPGLDRRTRSVIALTALVARGHWEELGLHLRGALRNGLSREEISEVLLQTAIYCGVPDANRAFAVARHVLTEGESDPGGDERA